MQRAVFGALLAWRDRVCREEDEGTGYVMPKAQLTTLAQNMPGARLGGRGEWGSMQAVGVAQVNRSLLGSICPCIQAALTRLHTHPFAASAKDLQRMLGRSASDVLTRRSAEVVDVISVAKEAALSAPPPKTVFIPVPAAAPTAPAALAAAAGPAVAAPTAAAAEAPAPLAPAAVPAAKAVAPIRTKRSCAMLMGRAAAAAAAAPAPAAPAAAAAHAPSAAAGAAPAQQQPVAAAAEAAGAEAGQVEADAERAKRLKASFALPFQTVVPKSAALAAAGKAAQQQQQEEEQEEMEGVEAEGEEGATGGTTSAAGEWQGVSPVPTSTQL